MVSHPHTTYQPTRSKVDIIQSLYEYQTMGFLSQNTNSEEICSMSLKYKDKFYNHFQRKDFRIPPHYSKEENFLTRFQSDFEHHEFIENATIIALFKEGKGVFQRKGRRLKVEKDGFFVLNPNEGWEFLNENRAYVDVLGFGITKSFSSKYSQYLKSDSQQILDNPFDLSDETNFFLEKPLSSDYFESGKLLQHIYKLSNIHEFDFLCPEELTIAVLQSVYKEQLLGNKIVNKIEAKKLSTKEETLKRLLIAYEFIHDNIQNQISVEQLSLVSSLSKFHLYDSFKKAFGKTPHQYINRLKMAKAKEFIQNGDLSISEVSDLFGFSDLAVFGKVFKKAYGQSPSSFRVLKRG